MENNTINKEPNFFVVGVVKGGTTSLYHYLNAHPQIYLSPIKEVNFFSKNDIRSQHFSKQYAFDVDIDLERYFKEGMKENIHIAHVENPEQYMQLFSKVTNETAVGEISNSYAICPSAASEIHKIYPHAKIIIMLRNPIERAWSQYIMNLREGKTLEKNFIKEIEKDYTSNPKGWGVTHQYIELGMYFKQIERFRNLFKDSLKIVLYEDYKLNSKAVVQDIYSFLNVDKNFIPNAEKKYNESAVPRFSKLNYFLVKTGVISTFKKLVGKNTREKLKKIIYTQKNIPKIEEEHRIYLSNIYREDIKKLSNLLQIDLINYWKIQ